MVTADDATMVVEAYAIPASLRPWHDLVAAMREWKSGPDSLLVNGVTILGRDDGRVLARAYISGDVGMFTDLFEHMVFNRGGDPMAPMTRLSAKSDE